MQLARRCVLALTLSILLGSSTLVRAAKPTEAQIRCIVEQLQASALSPQDLKKSREAFLNAPAQTKALRRKLQKEGFTSAALNEEILKNHNTHYTKEIPDAHIWDQQRTGDCWDMSACRVEVDELIRRGVVGKGFRISTNDIYFKAMYEKSNKWLVERVSQFLKPGLSDDSLLSITDVGGAVGDGGFYEYFPFIVAKYGAVPQSAMKSTASFRDSSNMNQELSRKLAAISKAMLEKYKSFQFEKGQQILNSPQVSELLKIREDGMKDIFNILGSHLGVPPEKFTFRFKDGTKKVFTPKQFAHDVLRFNPKKNVVISSDPTLPYDQAFAARGSEMGIERPKDPDSGDQFLNVQRDRLLELVKKSIDHGHAVWFGADANQSMIPISHSDPRAAGIMHPRIFKTDDIYRAPNGERFSNITDPKEERLFGLTEMDHAMAIVGYDLDENGNIIKLKVANSWGKKAGTKGYFHMYKEWFDKYVTEAAIQEGLLGSAERELLAKPKTPL
ncbi:MAG: C1 family peptidase [Bdellovibrionia bacterium]